MKNWLSHKVDTFVWYLAGKRTSRIITKVFGSDKRFKNTIRYNLYAGSIKISFSAPEPKSSEELGKLLVDIGELLQSEKTRVSKLPEPTTFLADDIKKIIDDVVI